ncbi:MAG: hypothetical protein RR827_05785 [Oscillospiraceae bacterium]
MNSYKKPIFLVVVILLLSVAALWIGLAVNPMEGAAGFSGVNAIILEIDKAHSSMLVEGIDKNSVIGNKCFVDFEGASFIDVPTRGETHSLALEDFSVGDTIILFIGTVQESYPTRAKATTVQLVTPPLNARRPMVMVDGCLYLDTNKEISVKIEDNDVVGKILSSVDSSKIPTENGQCNFVSGVGAKYAFYNDGLALFLTEEGDKWIFYEKDLTINH